MPTWTLLLPVWKAFTSIRNQLYVSDTSRNLLQFCLVFHSILDLLQKPLSEQTLTQILWHYFIINLVKNIYPKEHEQKRWETRRHRLFFVYQNNSRNESITLASKKLMERLHVFRKSSFLDLVPLTMIHADPMSILMIKFRSIHWYSVFPGKTHRLIFNVYKKWVLWYGLEAVMMISDCN